MFFDIFYDLCKKKGISCKKAAEDIGLSNSITTKWKKTGATPGGDTLNRIANYFDVSTDYLLGKENKKAPAETGKRSNDSDILDEVDIAFYGDYKELTEENKETLRAMARLFRERQGKQE